MTQQQGIPLGITCICGGEFHAFKQSESYEDGAGPHTNTWTEDHCNKCGRSLEDVAAEAERKLPVAVAIIGLRPTGTEQH